MAKPSLFVLIFPSNFNLTLAGVTDFINIPLIFISRLAVTNSYILGDFFHISVSGFSVFVMTFLGHKFTSQSYYLPRRKKVSL